MTSRSGHPYCDPRTTPWERPDADPGELGEFKTACETQRRRDLEIAALRRETAEAERKKRKLVVIQIDGRPCFVFREESDAK